MCRSDDLLFICRFSGRIVHLEFYFAVFIDFEDILICPFTRYQSAVLHPYHGCRLLFLSEEAKAVSPDIGGFREFRSGNFSKSKV